MLNNMIDGVKFKKMITHIDHRGYFREIIKSDNAKTNKIGQVSHSLVYPGIIKAWHVHKEQSQWNYVVSGVLFVVLHDLRNASPTFRKTMSFLAGVNQMESLYLIPSGVAHGYKCLDGPVNIIYITSGEYDPEEEVKKRHDDHEIGFNWLATHDIT